MISIFLGAGFSAPANVPLASQLFDVRPDVDRVSRERLVDRVLQHWNNWRSKTGGSPEEYLADLQPVELPRIDGLSWAWDPSGGLAVPHPFKR